MNQSFHIGITSVDVHPKGTVTHLSTGDVHAFPQKDEYQVASATSLGYEGDYILAGKEHDTAHVLLAWLLGLKESPTLAGVAARDYWPHWEAEEAAILALQKYARMAGVDLLRRASEIVDIEHDLWVLEQIREGNG